MINNYLKRFFVKVILSKDEARVVGVDGERLKIKITAPTRDGLANEQLVDILAIYFALPKKQIVIKSGHQSRLKTVEVYGLD